MGKLADWVRSNAKEGANLAEFEELESKLTFEGITTKEQAMDFIKKNPVFSAAKDTFVTEGVKTHDEKFNAEKLPELEKSIRSKVEQELNPEKTPEQKRLEELEAKIKENELEKQRTVLAKKLVSTASEMGFNIDLEYAEDFTLFGDKAEDRLKKELEARTAAINSGIESKIKEMYGNNPPTQRSTVPPDKIMGRSAYEQLSPENQSKFISDGGSVTDE